MSDLDGDVDDEAQDSLADADEPEHDAAGEDDAQAQGSGEAGDTTPALPEPAPDVPRETSPPCSLPPVCSPGDSRAGRALNAWLVERGFLKGPVGSVYDARTSAAVQKAQRYARTAERYTGPINGLWNEATRDALCRTPRR